MKHQITISKDGWVSLATKQEATIETGLGDIGVDVEIVDERVPPQLLKAFEKVIEKERARIIEEVEKYFIRRYGEYFVSVDDLKNIIRLT
jgi:phosphopantetheinyl transferase